MQNLLNNLVDLERSLRSIGKTETADFIASLISNLRSGNENEIIKALNRMKGSASITQYASFSNEQEALYYRILEDAWDIRKQF
ncbi:MAG: hypothetical protein COA78_05205 [Blastopirellula sp.]|nr:MAG: hypothetical protein COA78_05205 [Blastopirellula sp.]